MRHCYQNADKTELIVIDDEGRHTFYPRACTILGNIGEDAGGGPADKVIEKAIDLGAAIATHKKRGPKPGSRFDGKKNVRGVRCGKCGGPGHNAKTCGREKGEEAPTDSQEEPWGEPLSRKQYSDAKLSFHHGMSSLDIASNMEVAIQEINAIQRSSNYDMYLGRRGTNPD